MRTSPDDVNDANAVPLMDMSTDGSDPGPSATGPAVSSGAATGLVNGDAVTAVALSSTGAAATAQVAGSPYAIIAGAATGINLGNYTIGYAAGALTIDGRALTITAANRAKIYGDIVTLAGTEFEASGLENRGQPFHGLAMRLHMAALDFGGRRVRKIRQRSMASIAGIIMQTIGGSKKRRFAQDDLVGGDVFFREETQLNRNLV